MQYLEKLFELQKQTKSPDLHFYVGHYPYFRGHDGELHPIDGYSILTNDLLHEIKAYLLTEAQIAMLEKEKDFEVSLCVQGEYRLRINFYHEKEGLAIVCRMIQNHIPTIDELMLPDVVKDIASFSAGLVLVTGPNGSGKSTTMASLIDHINQTRALNIITIEDPIEFVHTSQKSVITQREIGTHILSFDKAAKYLFRQDVNVVVIGELRDKESFSLALDIAETGHLVIATVHAENVPATLARVIDIFPPSEQDMIRTKLSLSLRAIISLVGG